VENPYSLAQEKGGVMGELKPFSSITEQYQLTEDEFLKLKSELAALRKEFACQTGVNHSKVDLKSLQNIEQKMYSIEHTLAHVNIVYDQPEEPRYQGALKSLLIEMRFTVMGMRLKVAQMIHPKKHGFTHHTTTYHLKR
jgi:hypothetical protein